MRKSTVLASNPSINSTSVIILKETDSFDTNKMAKLHFKISLLCFFAIYFPLREDLQKYTLVTVNVGDS